MDEQNKQSVKYRIGIPIAIVLLLVAGMLDLLELIIDVAGTFLAGFGVVLGYFKDFVVLVLFPAVFLLLKAPFWKGKKAKKKMFAMVTGFLISLMPWIGAIMPETLIGVAITIYLTRKEDKESVSNIVPFKNPNINREKRVRPKTGRAA